MSNRNKYSIERESPEFVSNMGMPEYHNQKDAIVEAKKRAAMFYHPGWTIRVWDNDWHKVVYEVTSKRIR
jgi:hypothetical protein